jgi:hypothetical protein
VTLSARFYGAFTLFDGDEGLDTCLPLVEVTVKTYEVPDLSPLTGWLNAASPWLLSLPAAGFDSTLYPVIDAALASLGAANFTVTSPDPLHASPGERSASTRGSIQAAFRMDGAAILTSSGWRVASTFEVRYNPHSEQASNQFVRCQG